ncbi:MAG: hypothetical protein ACON5A_03265 [Candidatus Comchoanobacterales bacterium]
MDNDTVNGLDSQTTQNNASLFTNNDHNRINKPRASFSTVSASTTPSYDSTDGLKQFINTNAEHQSNRLTPSNLAQFDALSHTDQYGYFASPSDYDSTPTTHVLNDTSPVEQYEYDESILNLHLQTAQDTTDDSPLSRSMEEKTFIEKTLAEWNDPTSETDDIDLYTALDNIKHVDKNALKSEDGIASEDEWIFTMDDIITTNEDESNKDSNVMNQKQNTNDQQPSRDMTQGESNDLSSDQTSNSNPSHLHSFFNTSANRANSEPINTINQQQRHHNPLDNFNFLSHDRRKWPDRLDLRNINDRDILNQYFNDLDDGFTNHHLFTDIFIPFGYKPLIDLDKRLSERSQNTTIYHIISHPKTVSEQPLAEFSPKLTHVITLENSNNYQYLSEVGKALAEKSKQTNLFRMFSNISFIDIRNINYQATTKQKSALEDLTKFLSQNENIDFKMHPCELIPHKNNGFKPFIKQLGLHAPTNTQAISILRSYP